MRVVNEINHPDCRITIFSWNNRYLIKFEQGHLEQTYKINEFDLMHEDDLKKIIGEKFIQTVLKNFENMAISLNEAMHTI
jgi:hypothetical protein